MTNPEALFGVVPFGRVDFGWAGRGAAWLGRARHGMESGVARQGKAWLGTARPGPAWHGMWRGTAGRGMARRGLAGRGEARNMAWRGTAGPGRAGQEHGASVARNMARPGSARHGAARPGTARRGRARQGKEHGRAHPQEQQTNTTQWNKHTAKHSWPTQASYTTHTCADAAASTGWTSRCLPGRITSAIRTTSAESKRGLMWLAWRSRLKRRCETDNYEH